MSSPTGSAHAVVLIDDVRFVKRYVVADIATRITVCIKQTSGSKQAS